MVSLNPGEQCFSIGTLRLLLAAAFVVAVHSDCGVPPRFSFAELREKYREKKQFAVLETVEYDCRPGYIRVSRSTPQCTRSSQWSEIPDFCKAKSCPHPGEPENGRLVILTDLAFGATVNFVCEEGYRLIGSADRQCVLEGKQVIWDKEIPFCQVIPCEPPPEIEHGTHSGAVIEEFNYGTSVTYQCNSVPRGQTPFSLIGEASIYCTSKDKINGEWSGPAPKCKGDEMRVSVSAVSMAGTLTGEIIFVHLKHTIDKQEDGAFQQLPLPTEPSLVKVPIRCPQPTVEHGRQVTGYSSTYTYKASVMFECVSIRYTLKGSSILECGEDNEWVPPSPVCERSSCDEPPDIHNTYHNSSNSRLFPAGTVVQYYCRTGYELIPGVSSLMTCQRDFTWAGHRKFCQKIKCQPPDVKNGRPQRGRKETYVYEDQVLIECFSGYILKSGSGWIACDSTGEWSPALPVCEAGCEKPRRINNGKYDSWKSIFPVGSVVTYSCEPGWFLVGESSLKCVAYDEETARWQGHIPECQEILCPRPLIKHGRHQAEREKYKFGDIVTFSCDPGYILEGHSRSVCTQGGVWENPLPVCNLGSCPYPPTIEHAVRSNETEFLVGTTVTYSCRPSYTLIPGVSPSLTCHTNFTWSEVSELCQKIRCRKPEIENGQHTFAYGTDYVYGSAVEFSCYSDYILKGNKLIKCDAHGMWSPQVPSCIKAGCPKPDVQNGRIVYALEGKMWYNVNENVTFVCSPEYQFSEPWHLSETDSWTTTCSADGNWAVLPKCKKPSNSTVCKMVRKTKRFLRCGMSVAELKTLLEVQKLYLEIQKLKKDLKKYNY